MPRKHVFQEDFTAGEIDEQLAAREDFDRFYKALDRAVNVFVQPTGGVIRRDGLNYVDEVNPDTTYYKNNETNNIKLISFNFGLEQEYVMVMYNDGNNGKLDVYEDDSFKESLTLPYSTEEIDDVDWSQTLDTLILVHKDYQPRRVLRSSGNFSIQKISFDNIPQHDFDDSNSPTEQNEIQDITFSNMSGGDSYDLSLEGAVSSEIKWDSSDSTNASRMEVALRRLPVTSPDGINVSHQSGSTYRVTFQGDDGNFDWEKIKPSVFTGSGSASTSVHQEGESGDEDVWSSLRGWPKTVTFYQKRLWFGGSKERPETVWGSKVGNFFDFGTGNNRDNDAIDVTMSNDEVSDVRNIYPGRNLQIMTGVAEYYVPEEPITPSNIAIKQATQRGSESVKMVESEGASIFVQRGGEAIREFIYTFQQNSYVAPNISLLASHLISNPISMSLRQSIQTNDADIAFIVNSNGKTAALTTNRNQNVRGFTELKTYGRFLETTVLDFDPYFICERHIPDKEPTTDSFYTKSTMTTARRLIDGAKHRDNFYVFGGYNGSYLTTNEYYDISEDTWKSGTDMPTKRRGHSVEKVGDTIYVAGGYNGSRRNEIEAYDANYDNWDTSLQNMPTARRLMASAEYDGTIYFFGGEDSNGVSDKVIEYEPENDNWTTLTSMPTARQEATAVQIGDLIYVVGGYDGNSVVSTLEVYDPADDSWDSTKTNMTTARRNMEAVQYKDDWIYVFGGNDGNGQISTVEGYNTRSDRWFSKQNLPTAREGLSGFGYNEDSFFAIGGTTGTVTDVVEQYQGQPVYFLEKMSDSRLLDSSEKRELSTNQKTFSSLGHLEGMEIDIHSDGFYRGTKTVDNGQITLDQEAENYVEFGLDFEGPIVELLPITFQVQGGSSVAAVKKRIHEIMVRMVDTKGITVNGEKIPFRNLGDNLVDAQIPAFTGDKYKEGNLGWSDKTQVRIEQEQPQPMNILGVLQKVSF